MHLMATIIKVQFCFAVVCIRHALCTFLHLLGCQLFVPRFVRSVETRLLVCAMCRGRTHDHTTIISVNLCVGAPPSNRCPPPVRLTSGF